MRQYKPKYDYLKYHRVIRYYILRKYEVKAADLDLMLFLYSEKYFGKKEFNHYKEIVSWEKGRFLRLLKEGRIILFREEKGRSRALYCLSEGSKRMITHMYKLLNGEEISMEYQNNPMFKKDVSYKDKVYKNMIIEMNRKIREERRRRVLG